MQFKRTIDLQTLNSVLWFSVMQGHVRNTTNQRHYTLSSYCKEIRKENIAVNAKLSECDGKLDILLDCLINLQYNSSTGWLVTGKKKEKNPQNSITKIHGNVRWLQPGFIVLFCKYEQEMEHETKAGNRQENWQERDNSSSTSPLCARVLKSWADWCPCRPPISLGAGWTVLSTPRCPAGFPTHSLQLLEAEPESFGVNGRKKIRFCLCFWNTLGWPWSETSLEPLCIDRYHWTKCKVMAKEISCVRGLNCSLQRQMVQQVHDLSTATGCKRY